MGGPSFSEVVVIGYVLVPRMSPEHYKIWKQSESFSASGTSRVVSDWYRRIIFRERYMLPHPRTKILFSEWRVEIGDERLFCLGSEEFDAVLVVLGVEKCYWVYYNQNMTGRREEGMGEMKCSYCNCCIKDQYLNILGAIRDMILERLK